MASRKSKYGNRKVMFQGIKFDSKRERDRYIVLLDDQKNGKISDLELQSPIFLEGRDGPLGGGIGGGQMRLTVDFKYTDNATGQTIYEDAKGFATPDYKVRRSVAAAQGVEIKET